MVEEHRNPHLSLGTVLAGRYRLDEILGQGGFGITYLAHDVLDEIQCAVKEFFPLQIASRTANGEVAFASFAGQDFHFGLEKFLDEAKALKSLERCEGIVSIRNYFELNNTGYVVMSYVAGRTLERYLEDKGGTISWPEARSFIYDILGTLESVHKAGMYHRDICPANIYVVEDSREVLLLDFGAARFAMDNATVSFDVILRPGYAPIEQYKRRGRQGEYTDVYAVAATLYRCLVGKAPPESIDRMGRRGDELRPPSQLGVCVPRNVEEALDQALAIEPFERVQSVTEFRRLLAPQVKTRRAWSFSLSTSMTAIAIGVALLLAALLSTSMLRRPPTDVDQLLSDASKLHQERVWVKEDGSGAYGHYQTILNIDPTNVAAIEGRATTMIESTDAIADHVDNENYQGAIELAQDLVFAHAAANGAPEWTRHLRLTLQSSLNRRVGEFVGRVLPTGSFVHEPLAQCIRIAGEPESPNALVVTVHRDLDDRAEVWKIDTEEGVLKSSLGACAQESASTPFECHSPSDANRVCDLIAEEGLQ